jgi:hypothetical protein
MVSTTPTTAVAPSLTNANAAMVVRKPTLQRPPAPHVQLVLILLGVVLLYVFLKTPRLALPALMEATPLKAPRGAPLAPVVLLLIQIKMVAQSVRPVPLVLPSLLEVAKLVLLVPLPRLEPILVPLAALANFPQMMVPPPAPHALWIPTPPTLAPPLAKPATLDSLLLEKLVLLNAVAAVLEPTITPPPKHALTAKLAFTKTVKARKLARNALLANSAMKPALKHVTPALLVNISQLLVPRAAVPAPAVPSLPPARAPAPFATRESTLPLVLLLVPAVPLDIMPTNLDPEHVLPALLAPNALVLPARVPPFALKEISNLSLPRPLAPLAPRKLTPIRLVLLNVQPVLLLILSVCPLALPLVAGCFSLVSTLNFLSKHRVS